jgi:hypothetical protein
LVIPVVERLKPVACKRPVDNWSEILSSTSIREIDATVPKSIATKLRGTLATRAPFRCSAPAPSSMTASARATKSPIMNTALNSVRNVAPPSDSDVEELSSRNNTARNELAAWAKEPEMPLSAELSSPEKMLAITRHRAF